MALGVEMDLGPGHIALDEYPAPLQKRGQSPQFSAHVYCGQTAGWIKMPLGTEVRLGLGDTALDGDPAPHPLKGHSPNFGPMSVVAKWLDGLRCHLVWRKASAQATFYFVFDENPAAPRKRAQPHPIFGPCLLWPNGWMDEDTTWHAVNLGPGTLF